MYIVMIIAAKNNGASPRKLAIPVTAIHLKNTKDKSPNTFPAAKQKNPTIDL
jgi:hypothetical protein